jgi:tetratricopeptide (TPR) repeat protein
LCEEDVMKRTFVIAIAAVALFGACSSTPEPVEPPDDLYDEAKSLRSDIEELDLAQYAQSQYADGESAFNEGETQYNAEEFAAAETQFNTAISKYQEVVQMGLRARRTARKGSADDAKVRAEGVKAEVAVAQEYNAAKAVYDEAEVAAAAGDEERAAELFENAEVLFDQAYELAAEKKRLAEAALNNLDQSLLSLDTKRQSLESDARNDLGTTDEEGAQ